jgi:type I restriction enzyme R subunit
LNRTKAGKDRTFILDFQNTIDDIQKAFKPFFEATTIEAQSDPNQIYDLHQKLFTFGYLEREEIDRFSETYFRGSLKTADRPRLEGLVRQAVARFEAEEDEKRQEEFRQLLKSYNRFYAFIAQVVRLDDTDLEKLASYGTLLARLLPDRELPPEIGITEDMLRLHAFKIEEKESASASLAAGFAEPLPPITEFGAKPFTEDEQKELSEIIRSFNERHGTEFTEEQFRRLEAVNAELDDDMNHMLRNNPRDVVASAYSQTAFQSMIRLFQDDKEMRDIILTDNEVRQQVIDLLLGRAIRSAREAA